MIVAIIDDREAKLIARQLRSPDLQIFPFSDWREFVKWYTDVEADWIILDLAIAVDMDGFLLGETVKALRPDVNLLFITGKEIKQVDVDWGKELDAEVIHKGDIEKVKEIIGVVRGDLG